MATTPQNAEVRVLGSIVAGFFPTSFFSNQTTSISSCQETCEHAENNSFIKFFLEHTGFCIFHDLLISHVLL